DMLIVKGCNIFPMQIEGVLMKIPDLGSNYLLTLETIDGVDELIIEVEVARRVDLGDGRRLEWLSATLTRQIRDEILVTPIVKLLPPDTLPQSEGKAVRVRERRQL
ncbi:MAG TPA: phenylacetate--CoA ligase, partial [Accumulibacter sp.]|nr:phenylacetate--CoA ligase [Accumulibacter sp.]